MPILGDRDAGNPWILDLATDRTMEEVLGFPRGVSDGSVRKLQDEAPVPNVGILVLHCGLGIRIVLGHHGDGHGILRQQVHRDDVVRNELYGINRHHLTIDI